jgi:N-methylhydantoinase A
MRLSERSAAAAQPASISSEEELHTASATGRFAIAVDIGGTFTDFVLLDRQRRLVFTEKILTTPAAPEQAIFDGIGKLAARAGAPLDGADLLLHATTIITNAVIERKGHDFILLHTAGFRDILEIGREHRYNLTNLKLRFPEPLSKRSLRLAVDERVAAGGEVIGVPDRERLLGGLRRLAEPRAIRNFAICFLHAYRNPANEELVRGWIEELYPDAHVSCASAIAPTQREYERWTTCTVNAYAMPLLADYVTRLQHELGSLGFRGRTLMMTSSGLPMDFERCVRSPVRLIESGPAAGVLAAREVAGRNPPPGADAALAAEARIADVLAFDMGGTTAKGAFLSGGQVHVQHALEVARLGAFEPGSGLPLMIPAIDLIEIGAGGGSIAAVDERGVIAVGPLSAGAAPGPACYDRGGEAPTVTDANLVLGLLDEENFRNSGIGARRALAHAAVEQRIARPLALSVERAARGIHETVNENVARAFRVHAAELGIDYRRYTLVCTGGSAPLSGFVIARILSIPSVVFPFGAGVSSAFGLFAGKEGITLHHTKVMPLHEVTPERVRAEVGRLVESEPYAKDLLARNARADLTVGMRYAGQGYEVAVALGDAARCHAAFVKESFHCAYRNIFGVIFPDYEIEIFNWTVEVATDAALSTLTGHRYDSLRTAARKIKGERSVWIGQEGGPAKLPVYDRYALEPEDVIEGGALVEENDATIYLPAFARGVVAQSLDILGEIRFEPRT